MCQSGSIEGGGGCAIAGILEDGVDDAVMELMMLTIVMLTVLLMLRAPHEIQGPDPPLKHQEIPSSQQMSSSHESRIYKLEIRTASPTSNHHLLQPKPITSRPPKLQQFQPR
jgi:hypothetical protein